MEAILDRGDLREPDPTGAELGGSILGVAPMALGAAPMALGAADSKQYELTVETENGETRRFSFDELAVPPEVLELLDDLREETLRCAQEEGEDIAAADRSDDTERVEEG